ncbi:hypothetical protein HHK36_026162 [Tetracentron sinense]|uniref:CCAAT-binding factor domain-containing protein n=1 Tax=Tetracentron sinense TaxID=13715 RepID=A0A834YNX3_TETSI|nr:hypothetical protein HHK36_026162 [Tetracentron sinense]
MLSQVFLSLLVDENVGRSELLEKDKKVSNKRKNRSKNSEDPKQLQAREKKKSRKELLENTRKEVNADFKATSFTPDVMERRSMQSETLSAVFQTYFRILKHAMQPAATRSKVNTSLLYGAFGAYPLLSPCLNGLGKFSHLIDLDFMGDLMTSLKTLACGGSNSDGSPGNCLTVSERLRCCIVAFKVMRNNLDALNVDLQDFFAQFYNLLLEYRPDREDRGEVLAEALKMMLCDVRQHDMQRAAAFNAKCRNLLENDAGGGSVSGSVLKYHPYVLDPNLSGALSSVLWELSLLSKHYHPAVKEMASSILSMSTAHNQIHLSIKSPPEAFGEYSLERESFTPKSKLGTLNRKRKKGSESSKPSSNWSTTDMVNPGDEEEVKKRFSEHFMLLRDITENERLRGTQVPRSISIREDTVSVEGKVPGFGRGRKLAWFGRVLGRTTAHRRKRKKIPGIIPSGHRAFEGPILNMASLISHSSGVTFGATEARASWNSIGDEEV